MLLIKFHDEEIIIQIGLWNVWKSINLQAIYFSVLSPPDICV